MAEPYLIDSIVGARIGAKNQDEANQGGRGHALGTIARANDGHEYIYAEASASIASGATTILTENGFTMATGAGDWTNPAVNGALVAGDTAWFQRTAI